MTYLTLTEYEEMGFAKISGPFSFDQLLKRATPVLDNITRHFYRKNDMEGDYPYRVEQFKHALGAQIEYFNDTQSLTSESLNSTPQSQSIGDTTISMASGRGNGGNDTKPIVCPDVYLHLELTGLLHRGVC